MIGLDKTIIKAVRTARYMDLDDLVVMLAVVALVVAIVLSLMSAAGDWLAVGGAAQ